jgi:hypothetical protein
VIVSLDCILVGPTTTTTTSTTSTTTSTTSSTTTTTTTAEPTTTTTTTTEAPLECYIYEYINTTESTTFSFGPYPLCPGPGDFDIQIAPSAEGVTFCIEQLSQGTIDGFNAMGLTLTEGPCPTTTTTTTTAGVSCGQPSSYSGGVSYPTTESVTLGTDTGTVVLDYNAQSVPDRFIVEWNSNVVIDTGYRGGSQFDFGGGSRSAFTSSLTGNIDPITLNTYPDFATYPDDGYPRILGLGLGTTSFVKNSASDTFAIIKVYAPMSDTVWSYQMNCPPS